MRLCLPEKSHSELRLWAKPPCPPTRSDTSVPGTTKERGKLPAMTGPPGPPGGAPGGGTWASWSIRRCSNSWLARRSPNSSALALGNAVINATAAVNPPSAATVPIFRLLVIGPPKQKLPTQRTHVPLISRMITRLSADFCSLSHTLLHIPIALRARDCHEFGRVAELMLNTSGIEVAKKERPK